MSNSVWGIEIGWLSSSTMGLELCGNEFEISNSVLGIAFGAMCGISVCSSRVSSTISIQLIERYHISGIGIRYCDQVLVSGIGIKYWQIQKAEFGGVSPTRKSFRLDRACIRAVW